MTATERPSIRLMADGRRMQCKDIPDTVFIDAMLRTPSITGSLDPVRWRRREDVQATLEEALGPIPENLFVAKARRLIFAGKLGGCDCGCRGDYHLPAACSPPCCHPPTAEESPVTEQAKRAAEQPAQFRHSIGRTPDGGGIALITCVPCGGTTIATHTLTREVFSDVCLREQHLDAWATTIENDHNESLHNAP